MTNIYSWILGSVFTASLSIDLLREFLSVITASLISIDCKFKFRDKSVEKKVQVLINKLNKIRAMLECAYSYNGNLSEDEYLKIFKEFDTVL